ncbi:response regulator transcription factor [cf. Phormidesmis sp. LEGE 11477]|uniref:response regulator transcription factor n=1 Tax=cf. Phormidesmis sp. LEGE 11477 TaxID=1828680 RepID=UPI00187DE7B2|nr:response regulator [cf. Phormidesmis sp. LEGE 11477]MBE9062106.1 response regulator [cf. Phormidesmis sp. LEGE 11477]
MSSVLVVDDSPMLREMISGLLTKTGWTVSVAQDGFEAKAKIAAELPDLVVLDVVMPNMNGYELCRWIKNNEATENILVVLCSSKGEEFDRYWGIKQGADAYVIKPFRPGELLDTVKALLAGKAA